MTLLLILNFYHLVSSLIFYTSGSLALNTPLHSEYFPKNLSVVNMKFLCHYVDFISLNIIEP